LASSLDWNSCALHSKGFGKWSQAAARTRVRPRHDESGRCESDVKDAGVAHWLKLVHFHVGSAGAGHFDDQTRSAGRRAILRKAVELGHELGYLDVGGGLGVDYDGSRSDFDSSTNYSLQEYANDVVWSIIDVCDSEGVAHR